MTTTDQPDVRPGQVWRDRSARSVGTGEFVILAVAGRGSAETDVPVRLRDRAEPVILRAMAGEDDRAVVHRRDSDRVVAIRCDRLHGSAYECVAGCGR